ncbi:MAG: hypothetical protein FWE67_09515, partial [Planctomycetaceae bacterium]|nr:hypothetical protein [Planctomycetaceae bacterium]
MKNSVTSLLLLISVFVPLCIYAEERQKRVVVFPVIDTPKSEFREASIIEPGAVVYPREVYYGDSIFIVHTAKNVGEDKCRVTAMPGIYDFKYNGLLYAFSAEGINGKYSPMWESPSLEHADYFYSQIVLEPNETGVTSGIELALPPLEDWNTPFWKAIRKNLPLEGRKITLSFLHYAGKYGKKQQHVELIIKPRPEREMAMLQYWFDSVDKYSLPIERNLLYGYPVKGPRDPLERQQIPLSQRKTNQTATPAEAKIDQIELGGTSYPIASFLCFSHRKPPPSLAPASLDDWRKLRDAFSKSTIRTELEFVVHKMEYLDAYRPSNPAPQLEKRGKIVEWL